MRDSSYDTSGEYITYDELAERIEYCEKCASQKDEYSAQYAARALYLESQYYSSGNWAFLLEETQVPGKVKVDESDYHFLMENNCDDYAYQDVYENGMDSMYSWMVWAIHHEHCDFCSAIVQWAQDHDMELPTWLEDAEDYM